MPVLMEASQSPKSVSEKHAVGELTLQLTCGGIWQAAAEAKAASEKAAAEKAAADAKVVIFNRDYFTICVFSWLEYETQPYK